jgi:pimeloyl-ACP methyl ester carboxylesterase
MQPTQIVTPDQRLRIFVSSTLEELAVERRAVRAAIESLHLTPVMFELGARPHPPRDLYRAYLEQSQVFIGLYWERYGWIGPEMEISGLEDEYLLSAAKPRLVYVKVPAPAREDGLRVMLESMRSSAEHCYKEFITAEELQELVTNDLALLLSERFEGNGRGNGRPERSAFESVHINARASPEPVGARTGVRDQVRGVTQQPRIRLTKTADLVSIAYLTAGKGPPIVITPYHLYSHILKEWNNEVNGGIFRRLAQGRSVVRFDGRGTGLSQRDRLEFSFEARVADLDAVFMAAVGERATLIGMGTWGIAAVRFAAENPEKVSHLVLYDVTPAVPYADDHPGDVMTKALSDALVETGIEYLARTWASTMGADEEWFAEYTQAATTTEAFKQARAIQFDCYDFLPRVKCPTLVIHELWPGEHMRGSQEMVGLLPNAQLQVIERTVGDPWNDFADFSSEVYAFLDLPTPVTCTTSVDTFTMPASLLGPRTGEPFRPACGRWALQVPGNPPRPKVVGATQVEDLLLNGRPGCVGPCSAGTASCSRGPTHRVSRGPVSRCRSTAARSRNGGR